MRGLRKLLKDVIAGFAIVTKNFCRGCKLETCTSECNYFHAASQGHLNVLEKWVRERGGA